MSLHFTVYGTPIPKGSTRAFIPKGWTLPVITADNRKTKPWQEAVVSAAREALNGAAPMQGAVSLEVVCFLPRPKSLPKRIKQHIKRPDLDKLVRTIKDGLTRAGVYRDDAQVVELVARKGFGEVPGAEITVFELFTTDPVAVRATSPDAA